MRTHPDGPPHYGRSGSLVFVLVCIGISTYVASRYMHLQNGFASWVLIAYAPVIAAVVSSRYSFMLADIDGRASDHRLLSLQERASSWTSAAVLMYVILGFVALFSLLE